MHDLSEFIETERPRLVGVAYLLTGSRSDAEDAVQAALERLTAKDLSDVRDLASYARRAVVNECTSWRRSLARRERFERSLTSVQEHDDLIDALDLTRALNRLGDKHRAVMVLRYYLDLDDEAIAQILDCAPATVRSRASRALRKLRSDLNEGEA